MMNRYARFIMVLVMNIMCLCGVAEAEHNVLPRFPEIVIEKEYSQYFKVSECTAKAEIRDEIASTKLVATLVNISDKEVSSSVKFRILYPTNINNISIKIDGKNFKYTAENPRYAFTLKAGESVNFEMKTNVSVNYSIDAVKKAIKQMEEEQKSGGVRKVNTSVKEKGQALADGFMKLFKANDRQGKRFQISQLVSKWGVFPVDFEKLDLQIVVPEKFAVITDNESIWTRSSAHGGMVTYKTTDVDYYMDAIFLPETDVEHQKATLRVLKSDLFKK